MIQNSGVVLSAWASSQAVSGVTPRLPRTSSLIRCTGTPKMRRQRYLGEAERSEELLAQDHARMRGDAVLGNHGEPPSLVVVGQSDFVGVVALPAEDEPPLVVDADRVEALELTLERLQPIARR